MPELTREERKAIIERRGCRSDRDKKIYPISKLIIHHKDRHPRNNAPTNLRVLTKIQHRKLHKRAKR